ncbi:hypothetical protein [Microbacterium sp. K24]|uniref:hypothetical protein n=1 Tax=Microbacterium sp. K24 TaxID=2305446 RepID=UPI00109D34B2|nr:hypothetical protein [Microbacterium sp. K24]
MKVTRPRQELDDAHRERLERAAEARRQSDAEMKAAVLAAASDGGGSVRVIADAGRLSTATVRKWIADASTD